MRLVDIGGPYLVDIIEDKAKEYANLEFQSNKRQCWGLLGRVATVYQTLKVIVKPINPKYPFN